jgi:signal transduction histidine kinase
LTAIGGYAEALREGVVSIEDAVRTIGDEAERLGRLVGDLLDLARMNRPTSPSIRPRSTSAEVASDAVRRYEPQAAAFGVSLTASRTGRPGGRRRRPRLQVVSNLVENALRLTPPGGEVRVVASPAAVRSRTPARSRSATIASMRSSASTSIRATAGAAGRTGPRLAIVKELTQAMGGRSR